MTWLVLALVMLAIATQLPPLSLGATIILSSSVPLAVVMVAALVIPPHPASLAEPEPWGKILRWELAMVALFTLSQRSGALPEPEPLGRVAGLVATVMELAIGTSHHGLLCLGHRVAAAMVLAGV